MVDPILASFYTNTSDSLFVCAQLMPFQLSDSDSVILILADSVNSYLLRFSGKYDSTNYQLNFRIPLTVNAERFTYSIRYSGNQSKFIHHLLATDFVIIEKSSRRSIRKGPEFDCDPESKSEHDSESDSGSEGGGGRK